MNTSHAESSDSSAVSSPPSPGDTRRVLALRGAITVDADTVEEVSLRTTRLLETLYARNGLTHDDVISVTFTATPDVRSIAPAAAARAFGLTEVPLSCTQEMVVDGSLTHCIRLLALVETPRPRPELRHVYLRGAVVLRPELAEPGDEQ